MRHLNRGTVVLQFVCKFCTRVFLCPCKVQRADDLIMFVITMKLYIESEFEKRGREKKISYRLEERGQTLRSLSAPLHYDLPLYVLCSTGALGG